MGLDMFVYKRKKLNDTTNEVDTDFLVEYSMEGKEKSTQIYHWRKNYFIHTLMKEIYVLRYGGEEEFNCVKLELDTEDINKIEKAIIEGDSIYLGDDNEFIKVAREALSEGYAVTYVPWW